MGFRIAHAGIVAVLAASLGCMAFATRAADALPTGVATALDRGQLPRDAFVAMVQEVGPSSIAPRLSWRSEQSVNPASLMKLLTAYAALDTLGPAWTWSTPVWLQGSLRDGVLDGNLVIKGSGDPKLVVERVWLLLRRVQQLGVREIRGDIVLDRSAFVVPERDAADFDGDGLRPYNVGADALMINYKSVVFTFTPDPAHGVATIAPDVPLAGVRMDASVPLGDGPCDDWRSMLRADFADPARHTFAGRYPAACGERSWALAYVDPKRYADRAIAGIWGEIGGRLGGTVRDGVAPNDGWQRSCAT